ncbi:hypothetical protein GOB57_09500 [Sinorhizobium meliloti]|nr:hypothetical protein [Sinorhizobium meliloti]
MITVRSASATTGGERLASTLSLFSRAFTELEAAGLIVRDFPQANEGNIWIFGYLLEAVRDAATVEKFERRHLDHEQMLLELTSHLEWGDNERAAEAVRSRMITASSSIRSGDAYDASQRLAHMRRFATFAWGVASEMHVRGIWPSHDGLEVYRQAYEAAVVPADTPCYLLSVLELANDISREVAVFDTEAALIVAGYRTWRRRLS